MRKTIAILFLSISLSGCALLKEETGEFVKQAVVDKIKEDVDARLAAHGVSLAQVQTALADPSGKITKQSVAEVAKESATQIALGEGKKIVDAEIERLAASKSDLDSQATKLWNWLWGSLLTLISGYLGTKMISIRNRAKTDKAFHDRLVVLEKLTGMDLDGSGAVGDDVPPESPIPAPNQNTGPPKPEGPKLP